MPVRRWTWFGAWAMALYASGVGYGYNATGRPGAALLAGAVVAGCVVWMVVIGRQDRPD